MGVKVQLLANSHSYDFLTSSLSLSFDDFKYILSLKRSSNRDDLYFLETTR